MGIVPCSCAATTLQIAGFSILALTCSGGPSSPGSPGSPSLAGEPELCARECYIPDSPSLLPVCVDRLTQLPTELQAQILEHLPNFSSLFSAIQTCRNMYNAYRDFDRRILHMIFRRQCDKTKGNKIDQVFRELVFAIRHAFVKREIVKEVFTMGWELFRKSDLEELLLPLGRALAWSYWREGEAEMEAKTTKVEDGAGAVAKWEVTNEGGNRKRDAVSLLKTLVYGQEPFGHKPPPRKSKYRGELQRRWPRVGHLPTSDEERGGGVPSGGGADGETVLSDLASIEYMTTPASLIARSTTTLGFLGGFNLLVNSSLWW